MPHEHFHVHGPHDHQLEHAAEHEGADSFAGRMAVTTAILATLGAIMSFAGGDTATKAQLYKNNAAITKTQANDQWSYYQAKGSKQNLAELGAVLSVKPEQAGKFQADIEKYKKQKDDIKAEADKLEEDSKKWNERSDEELHHHHRWALAGTAMQISIALAAIAVLTRRRWLVVGVYGVAAIGVALGAMAIAGV